MVVFDNKTKDEESFPSEGVVGIMSYMGVNVTFLSFLKLHNVV